MRAIWFYKNERRFLAMVLALVCISLLSFPSNNDIDFSTLDAHTSALNHSPAPAGGVGKDTWRSTTNPLPILDVFAQYTDFSQGTQRLLSEQPLLSRNNSYTTVLCGLSHGFSLFVASSLIYLSSQMPVRKIKYFLFASYSPHAPPYILA